MFVIAIGYGFLLPILPLMIERISGAADPAALSRHTGLLTGTYTLGLFFFAPLWGRLADRKGCRPVIVLGLAGFAVTLAVFALAENLPLLYLGRLLNGLFASSIAPAAYALVGGYAASNEWRARRFAFLNIAGAVGFLVGPMLGGFAFLVARRIVPEWGEESAFLSPFFSTAVLAVFVAVAVWVFVPQRPPQIIEQHSTVGMPGRRAVLFRLLAISFVTAAAVGAFEVGLSLRGTQVLGMSPYNIGLMFTECSLVMLLVQALVFSPLVKPEATRWLLTPSLLILAAALAAVPLAYTAVAIAVAVALVAASAGVLSPIATYWASLCAGKRQGSELGRQTAAASLGQAVGSAIGGLLFNITLLPNAAFTVTAILVLAALGASIALPRLLSGTDARIGGDPRRQIPN